MTKRTAEILKRLDETYGTEYICYLNHETPWQLLIAVILSAQCTDARVNIVTETLFKKYDTLEKFANADLAELEEDIRSTGFYHNKAKNIISWKNLHPLQELDERLQMSSGEIFTMTQVS